MKYNVNKKANNQFRLLTFSFYFLSISFYYFTFSFQRRTDGNKEWFQCLCRN